MPAITIFCHGTKSFSDERTLDPVEEAKGELVLLLEKYFKMPPDQQHLTLNGGKLLLQGVGSRAHDPRDSQLEESGQSLALVDKRRLFTAFGKTMSELVHTLGGHGIGSNIGNALTFLQTMVQEGMRPDCINMVGWSRGAVTCVRLAQALNESPSLSGIDVNIFGGDPVPGFGRHQDWGGNKEYAITRNVKAFLHVMAMDVRGMMGPLFRPLLPRKTDGSGATVGMIPMPGEHSEVVMTEKGEPGELTMDLAIRFLQVHGSDYLDAEFTQHRRLALEQIAGRYDRIMDAVSHGSSYPVSSAYQQDGVSRRTRPSEFVGLTQFTGPDFESDFRNRRFINYHHRFIAEKIRGGASDAVADEPVDFGLKSLLSRMYS